MKSMTGFGRGQFTADGIDILAEVRSVNHRFLECTVRLPRAYSFLEEPIKKAVQQVAARGKALEPLVRSRAGSVQKMEYARL